MKNFTANDGALAIRKFYPLIFLAFGILIAMLSFAFVIKKPIDSNNPGVSTNSIYLDQIKRDWILGDGYLRHGGLFYDPATASQPKDAHYLGTGFINFIPYALQKIFYSITDRTSLYLMTIYSLFLPMLCSILLGIFSFRLSNLIVENDLVALQLGLSAQLVFQTFPLNLMYYWGYTPQMHGMIFCLIFANLALTYSRENSIGWKGTFVIMLLMMGSEYIYTSMYVLIMAALFFLRGEKDLTKSIIVIFFGSIIVYLLVKFTQYQAVQFYYPDSGITGSSLRSRMWFDGDVAYISSWQDLFLKKMSALSYGKTSGTIELLKWHGLLIFSACSAAVVLILHNKNNSKALLFGFCFLFSYLVYGLIFSQAVVVHSDLYEILLLVPCLLFSFALAPSIIYKKLNDNIYIVNIYLLFSLGYSLNQLRFYYINFKTV